MKKTTLLLFAMLAFQINANAQVPETFDGATVPAGWTTFIGTNGEGATNNWMNAGGYMRVAYEAVTTTAEDWLVSPLIPITPTTSLLLFDQTDAYAPDYGSSYTVRISTTSQTSHASFTIVDTQSELSVTGAAPLQFSPYTVDLAAYEGQSVYIAFVLEQNDGDYWFIDNVDLANQYATAPDPVTTPDPADLAVDVDLAQDTDYNGDLVIDAADAAYTFTWSDAATGDAPSGYTFYLDTATPPVASSFNASTNTGFTIYGLNYSTTYYWQIVASNAGGDAVGSAIWSFTTESDPSLSVEEFKTANLFSVYPNPVKDIVNIKTKLTLDSVEIYNQLGQRVFYVENIFNNSLNISNLSNGIYLMTIKADDKEETIKIIKE